MAVALALCCGEDDPTGPPAPQYYTITLDNHEWMAARLQIEGRWYRKDGYFTFTIGEFIEGPKEWALEAFYRNPYDHSDSIWFRQGAGRITLDHNMTCIVAEYMNGIPEWR